MGEPVSLGNFYLSSINQNVQAFLQEGAITNEEKKTLQTRINDLIEKNVANQELTPSTTWTIRLESGAVVQLKPVSANAVNSFANREISGKANKEKVLAEVKDFQEALAKTKPNEVWQIFQRASDNVKNDRTCFEAALAKAIADDAGTIFAYAGENIKNDRSCFEAALAKAKPDDKRLVFYDAGKRIRGDPKYLQQMIEQSNPTVAKLIFDKAEPKAQKTPACCIALLRKDRKLFKLLPSDMKANAEVMKFLAGK